MEPTFGGIFIIIFFSSGAKSVSGLVFTNGTFQVLQQHPQLKTCADRVLHENEYIGCRVLKFTGQCEGLKDSWEFNQTIEQGYAYANKLSVQENLQPPFTLIRGDYRATFRWKIPVVLETGSKIDTFISIPNLQRFPGDEEIFVLALTELSEGPRYGHNILLRIYRESSYIIESVTGNGILNEIKGRSLFALASPKELFTISLLTQPNAIAMIVDDKEVATLNLTAHIRKMRRFLAYRPMSYIENNVFLHGIKVTGVLK